MENKVREIDQECDDLEASIAELKKTVSEYKSGQEAFLKSAEAIEKISSSHSFLINSFANGVARIEKLAAADTVKNWELIAEQYKQGITEICEMDASMNEAFSAVSKKNDETMEKLNAAIKMLVSKIDAAAAEMKKLSKTSEKVLSDANAAAAKTFQDAEAKIAQEFSRSEQKMDEMLEVFQKKMAEKLAAADKASKENLSAAKTALAEAAKQNNAEISAMVEAVKKDARSANENTKGLNNLVRNGAIKVGPMTVKITK